MPRVGKKKFKYTKKGRKAAREYASELGKNITEKVFSTPGSVATQKTAFSNKRNPTHHSSQVSSDLTKAKGFQTPKEKQDVALAARQAIARGEGLRGSNPSSKKAQRRHGIAAETEINPYRELSALFEARELSTDPRNVRRREARAAAREAAATAKETEETEETKDSASDTPTTPDREALEKQWPKQYAGAEKRNPFTGEKIFKKIKIPSAEEGGEDEEISTPEVGKPVSKLPFRARLKNWFETDPEEREGSRLAQANPEFQAASAKLSKRMVKWPESENEGDSIKTAPFRTAKMLKNQVGREDPATGKTLFKQSKDEVGKAYDAHKDTEGDSTALAVDALHRSTGANKTALKGAAFVGRKLHDFRKWRAAKSAEQASKPS